MPLLFLLFAASEAIHVDAVVMSGLVFTHPSVVAIEIGYKPGDTIDEELFALGVTRLWNIGIFNHVDGHLERDEDGTVTAVYEFRERFFLAPVINFTVLTNSSFWVQGGLKDINTAGRFVDLEAAYERFNTVNGGYVALKEPRLFKKRVELFVRAERLSRPRPDFVQTRTRAIAEIGALALHDRFWFQVGVDAGYMQFSPPIVGPPTLPKDSWYSALIGSVRAGRIDTLRLRQRGTSIELRPTLGLVYSEAHPFYAQAIAEMLAFFLAGDRFNIALRLNGGLSTQVPSELLFYVGGLDQIRGFIDNYLRADAYLVGNAEVRAIAFDGFSDWLAIMGVAFVDAVVAHPTKLAAAVGMGVRILIPKFPRSGLRIDLAQPLQLNAVPQLSFGAFQFF